MTDFIIQYFDLCWPKINPLCPRLILPVLMHLSIAEVIWWFLQCCCCPHFTLFILRWFHLGIHIASICLWLRWIEIHLINVVLAIPFLFCADEFLIESTLSLFGFHQLLIRAHNWWLLLLTRLFILQIVRAAFLTC